MAAPDPSTVRYPGPWRHLDVRANGIRFHVVEAGPTSTSAPLVVLLHGFADIWWSWRHQLTHLSDAGYHTIAVDLRGYGDSDKPPRGYDGWTLAGDITGLIRAMGHTNAALVGHADGGLVCWAVAALHPRLVRSIALVSSPHPIALRRQTIRDSDQRAALLPYFLRYQVPLRPEAKLTLAGGAEVERLLRERSGAAWPRTDDFRDAATTLRSAIQIPGAAHSALEYQRWAFRSQFRAEGRRFRKAVDVRTEIPALHIHGDDDPYVLTETVRHDARWAPAMELRSLPGIGHFAHQEAPGEVRDLLLAHLASAP
ncbi:alpha/beta fold hydrolase [Actinomycetes bacterium M1A6_2h]